MLWSFLGWSRAIHIKVKAYESYRVLLASYPPCQVWECPDPEEGGP